MLGYLLVGWWGVWRIEGEEEGDGEKGVGGKGEVDRI